MTTFDTYSYRPGLIVDGLHGTDTDVDWRLYYKKVLKMLAIYNAGTAEGLHNTLADDMPEESVKMEIAAIEAREQAEGMAADIDSNKFYEFALPIADFDIAFMLTRKAHLRIDPQRITNLFAGCIQAHLKQRLINVLKPCFGKTKCGAAWGGTWNVNTDCPDYLTNTFFGNNTTHIFARTASAITMAHIHMLERCIMRHGFGQPGVSGTKGLILMVNSAQARQVETLADWSTLSGLPDSVVKRLSLDGIGTGSNISNCYVQPTEIVPENYVLMLALDTPTGIVARRIEKRPAARGLRFETDFADTQYPFRGATLAFSEGCTVIQPSAMAVLQLGAAGDSSAADTTHYVVPDFYA
jgi:hypothetical protein